MKEKLKILVSKYLTDQMNADEFNISANYVTATCDIDGS